MAENANKVKYGLKNVHYALFNEVSGEYVFETPIAIPGAVSLNLSTRGELTEFYADNTAYFTTTSNDGYEGDLEIALVPESFTIDVLGAKLDAAGVMFEDANVIPKPFALLYEFNGDKAATRHVIYNVSVARPGIEGSTKESSITVQTETLNLTATAGKNGMVKALVKADQAPYNTFYESVYTYVPAGPVEPEEE